MHKPSANAAIGYGTSRGTRAIQAMVEYAPATGGLALWMQHVDIDSDALMPASIANDGTRVFYAPRFETLPLAEQIGWVAHQTLHVAFRHVQRRERLASTLGHVDAQLYNACADALVNSTLSHLEWLRLPDEAVYLEDLIAQAFDEESQAESLLLKWDVERLYRAIDDRRPDTRRQSSRSGTRQDNADGGQSGARQSQQATRAGGQADTRLASEQGNEQTGSEDAQGQAFRDGPRSDAVRALACHTKLDLLAPASGERPEEAADMTREWAERLSRGHAADGQFSMLRTLSADLPRARTPWSQVLRRSLTRALVREPALSWSRPSRSWLANKGRTRGGRRLPWEPGTVTNKAVPRLVVVLDVSGSVDDELLHSFTAQLNAITRQCSARMTLIAGDDQVRFETQLEPGCINLASLPPIDGGGNTDFTPLLEAAMAHAPDYAVVLTDLEGPAQVTPPFPVLWAVPPEYANATPPFGRLLVLED